MNTSSKTGIEGERIAVEYLRRNGFLICHRNWRSGRYEIDIVARKSGVTHIIEVRTRRAGSLTPPERTITPSKSAALCRAAEAYVSQTRTCGEIEFDLVAVDIFPDGGHDVRYIADAVEMGW